jgi:hypothetical protein
VSGERTRRGALFLPLSVPFPQPRGTRCSADTPTAITFIVNMFYTSQCKQTYVHSIFRPVQIFQYGNLLYICVFPLRPCI